MTHPYTDLPDHSFWRRGVADQLWSEIRFLPRVPFTLAAADRIATGGSCFAQHIARHLEPLGLNYFVTEPAPEILPHERAAALQYGVYSARYGNVYTVRQLRQTIEFAFAERADALLVADEDGRWFDLLRPSIGPRGFASREELAGDRASHLQCVRRPFLEADYFVFTLGLTEAWFDRDSGIVFPVCPGTRAGSYDPRAHAFVNFRHAEVVRDLQWCIDFVREVNAKLRWIFTVSPVALAATATEDNVLVATTASKAVLRAAVSEICADNDACAYFPSYEICASAASFGQFLQSDLREISSRGVNLAMRVFGETFGGHATQTSDALHDGSAPADDVSPGPSASLRAAIDAACDEAFNDPERI